MWLVSTIRGKKICVSALFGGKYAMDKQVLLEF